MVGRLATAAGIAAPRLYVVDHLQATAFAIGWQPHNSALVLTCSPLERLPRDHPVFRVRP